MVHNIVLSVRYKCYQGWCKTWTLWRTNTGYLNGFWIWTDTMIYDDHITESSVTQATYAFTKSQYHFYWSGV